MKTIQEIIKSTPRASFANPCILSEASTTKPVQTKHRARQRARFRDSDSVLQKLLTMKVYNTTSRTEARDRANIYFINSKAAARMETTKEGEITITTRDYIPLAHFAIVK